MAGYSTLLAARRGPAPTAPAAELPSPAALPAPARLPAAPAAVEPPAAAVPRPADEPFPLRIVVQGLPADLPRAAFGIGTYATGTGAGFRWTPLGEATATANGELEVRAEAPAHGGLVAVLAAGPEHARHGYVWRQELTLPRPTGADAAVATFAVKVARVTFGPRPHAAVVLRLLRRDDPHWVPSAPDATALRAGVDEAQLWLGHGEYELADPLLPERRQSFQVPAAGPVVLSAAGTPARGDRP